MRNYVLIGVVLLAVAAAFFVDPHPQSPETITRTVAPLPSKAQVPKSRGTPQTDSRRVESASDGITCLPEVAQLARSLHDPAGSARQDIEILQQLHEIYRRVNGKNPIGLNFEIVEELEGKNGKKFAVLPSNLGNINSKGELVDRWGTPYFFHSVSDDRMEIQSAGPDRIFESDDDIGEITQL